MVRVPNVTTSNCTEDMIPSETKKLDLSGMEFHNNDCRTVTELGQAETETHSAYLTSIHGDNHSLRTCNVCSTDECNVGCKDEMTGAIICPRSNHGKDTKYHVTCTKRRKRREGDEKEDDKGRRIMGLIAQEIREIMPNAVMETVRSEIMPNADMEMVRSILFTYLIILYILKS